MTCRSRSFRRRAPLAAFCALTFTAPAAAQVIVKASDTTFFRLGTHIQFWADETQDATGGYSQNFLLRRVRLIVAGQIGPDLTFFLLTDNPRLGNAGTGTTTPTRNLASG